MAYTRRHHTCDRESVPGGAWRSQLGEVVDSFPLPLTPSVKQAHGAQASGDEIQTQGLPMAEDALQPRRQQGLEVPKGIGFRGQGGVLLEKVDSASGLAHSVGALTTNERPIAQRTSERHLLLAPKDSKVLDKTLCKPRSGGLPKTVYEILNQIMCMYHAEKFVDDPVVQVLLRRAKEIGMEIQRRHHIDLLDDAQG